MENRFFDLYKKTVLDATDEASNQTCTSESVALPNIKTRYLNSGVKRCQLTEEGGLIARIAFDYPQISHILCICETVRGKQV